MIVTDASPSTNEDAAHTTTLNELASKPASRPTTPSMLIHSSDAHDSKRACLAERYQAASRTGAAGVASGRSGSSVAITSRVRAELAPDCRSEVDRRWNGHGSSRAGG